MKTLLVMGIGNILLKDEGVGVFCVQALEKEDWPENVAFVDGGTFTQDLFYLFENYDHLLVLDAVRGGREPGTIYRLEEKDLQENSSQQVSLHDIDLLDSLKMAELLGKKPVLTVLGIEPEKIAWEMGLTQSLENAFPDYLELARKEITRILETF
ncbi:NiFeSe hydrogenase maturation protease [Desulfonatronovibrio hydrogenovorans]|uniref:NiFeSe hydrogenase maturation protease n=1 Tax=Desulfonatronovibrio hydrogenovorans TaxID=53245 RepID=UPI0004914467|nr:NiFeSe hydrogenase maturation protease [Desulfonatronovibrio hydrogenovorans]